MVNKGQIPENYGNLRDIFEIRSNQTKIYQKTLRLWCLDSSISLKNPRVAFPSRRIVEFIKELGVTIGCNGLSRSTAEMMHHLVNRCD